MILEIAEVKMNLLLFFSFFFLPLVPRCSFEQSAGSSPTVNLNSETLRAEVERKLSRPAQRIYTEESWRDLKRSIVSRLRARFITPISERQENPRGDLCRALRAWKKLHAPKRANFPSIPLVLVGVSCWTILWRNVYSRLV